MSLAQKRKILIIMLLSSMLALGVLLCEKVADGSQSVVTRNAYGKGEKTEEYELTIENEAEKEVFKIVVEEQVYTRDETEELFGKVIDELDTIVLGENKSFDRVEKDLNLVTELEDYPVHIQWQLNSYQVMNIEGQLCEENLVEEGTLLEVQGTISYGNENVIYVRNAMVYPLTREGTDKLLYEIQQEVLKIEESTREDASFELPENIAGKELQWSQKKESRWYYVLLIGVILSALSVYKDKEKSRKKEKHRKEELLRDYSGLISKFTMLLSTGTTVKNAWEKIVQSYEQQKEQMGTHIVYEEMLAACREMQGGVSETEAYERFGKRCGITLYMKFGTMLSQNLRKGSKGISDILRMEAIQSFEDRKSMARRLGEEAGTKLLMPMLGMLAVVLIMVMVPAFMTMQL